eukprot:1088841_1
MSLYCGNCGHEAVQGEAAFCMKCGSNLFDDSEPGQHSRSGSVNGEPGLNQSDNKPNYFSDHTDPEEQMYPKLDSATSSQQETPCMSPKASSENLQAVTPASSVVAPAVASAPVSSRVTPTASTKVQCELAADEAEDELRTKLIKFYKTNNPSKLADPKDIDKAVNKYVGNQQKLWTILRKKYGNKMSDEQKDALTESDRVINGLKDQYKRFIKPVEDMYKFPVFSSPALTDTDFDSKPMVLCIGQYSTGKTTFIKYLLERDFPGLRIGPEPTTDRFVAVMYGQNERIIPGNAAGVQKDKPSTALQKYGMAFLNKFEVAELPAPILRSLTFVDTPGVLSGSDQTKGRQYSFSEVIEWFAERADRILLLFDAHKLDISDELKEAIGALKGHDDKIRCVLNKADKVSNQQLMRVYGALMWSLGKVVRTPEVLRVYVGSFWDKPYDNMDNAALFDAERNDLLADLRSLPRHSAIRKVNELVKRTRQAKVHALIVTHLRNQFGYFGKTKKQRKLLENLTDEFNQVQQTYNLPKGDFPNVERFSEIIAKFDMSKFPKLHQKMIDDMDKVLSVQIPKLLKEMPNFEKPMSAGPANPFNPSIDQQSSSWNLGNLDLQQSWVISGSVKSKYDNIFHRICTSGSKVTGDQVRPVMVGSGVCVDDLKQIWDLADMDKDGEMDSEEFALCMFLLDELKAGKAVPSELPPEYVPPSRRGGQHMWHYHCHLVNCCHYEVSLHCCCKMSMHCHCKVANIICVRVVVYVLIIIHFWSYRFNNGYTTILHFFSS